MVLRYTHTSQSGAAFAVCISRSIKMSGRERGRTSTPVDEPSPDSNARITQLLELLVEQSGRGNGQFSNSRGPNHDDSQEKLRRQKRKVWGLRGVNLI
ncbi:arogenate dehydrogenase 1, chloroplastic [Dorcoceras hygrometricum]|uniref:Arogenate dehydrogenase 1, chloroplastic n=1 Tax=Dorcoceras hygrometricum TaxID=472368 RepID=A0A2Z6ZXV3_9LAMI|nr:arogenate dehydrogenase 1, chloroplastic [Dorcoceras hygrometricum]